MTLDWSHLYPGGYAEFLFNLGAGLYSPWKKSGYHAAYKQEAAKEIWPAPGED